MPPSSLAEGLLFLHGLETFCNNILVYTEAHLSKTHCSLPYPYTLRVTSMCLNTLNVAIKQAACHRLSEDATPGQH